MSWISDVDTLMYFARNFRPLRYLSSERWQKLDFISVFLSETQGKNGTGVESDRCDGTFFSVG